MLTKISKLNLVPRAVLGALLLFGLTACPEVVVKPEYRLVSVLPAPVTPGETVTAFGVLPDTVTLKLGTQLLETTTVHDGVQFVIPASFQAGEFPLEISGDGVIVVGSVSVNPRLDGLQLEGNAVRISGAGWGNVQDANVKVYLANQEIKPVWSGSDLLASLPVNLVYGGLGVLVKVGARISNQLGLRFEAATVTGKVTFPIPASSLNPVQSRASSRTSDTDRMGFVVFHQPGALDKLSVLNPALERTTLTSLGATKVRFSNSNDASTAFQALQTLIGHNGISSLEWDSTMHVSDAQSVMSASVPVQPGAGQWFLPLEGIPNAWKVTRASGVVVAVVDTGVDLTHPDLSANILPGYDFVDDDAIAQGISGHGTHVAGLIAANGKATGVAPESSILPVRVLRDDAARGSAFVVAQGVLWAAGLLEQPKNPHPANIINLSLGSNEPSAALQSAIQQVQAAGVLVVAAAGNDGGPVSYPAAYEGVVSVTALAGPLGAGLSYQPWYASRGAGIWITAYGGDTTQDQDKNGTPDGILSTDMTESGYGLRMGTSMATPQVAGLAALALASGTPAKLLRSSLAANSTDLGVHGLDFNFGYGLISGRLATPSSRRTYVMAIDSSLRVRSFALVQTDGTFELNNVPPQIPLNFFAATDENNNGVVAESGELISAIESHTSSIGSSLMLAPFLIGPTSGASALVLPTQ
jgi:serine protease